MWELNSRTKKPCLKHDPLSNCQGIYNGVIELENSVMRIEIKDSYPQTIRLINNICIHITSSIITTLNEPEAEGLNPFSDWQYGYSKADWIEYLITVGGKELIDFIENNLIVPEYKLHFRSCIDSIINTPNFKI